MKTFLLAIAFILGGILTSLAQAQIIPLTIDPTQSTVDVSINGSLSSSQLSGTATIDLQFSNPPSGNAQFTDLNLILDDALDASLFLFISASTSPGDVTISMVTPGAPGAITGTSFDQLANLLMLGGDLDISDPLGLAGGNQAIDLSTIDVAPFDFNSVNVTQSGDVVTVSSSFTISETFDSGGAGLIPIIVDVTYVASGISEILLCDVNLDGSVDFLDISPFIAALSSDVFQAEADCDMSGAVDFLDIQPFIAALSSQ